MGREVMTSQSLAVNSKVNSTSTLKVNSTLTLMTSSVSSTLMISWVSSTLISVTSTVNSVETANQNAQNSTVNSISTLMTTNLAENSVETKTSVENLTSTSVTTKTSVETLTSKQKKSQLVAAKEERANSSKKEREVMTSQSLEENSKVNSISTLMMTNSAENLTSIWKTSQKEAKAAKEKTPLKEAKEKAPLKEEDQQNSYKHNKLIYLKQKK